MYHRISDINNMYHRASEINNLYHWALEINSMYHRVSEIINLYDRVSEIINNLYHRVSESCIISEYCQLPAVITALLTAISNRGSAQIPSISALL